MVAIVLIIALKAVATVLTLALSYSVWLFGVAYQMRLKGMDSMTQAEALKLPRKAKVEIVALDAGMRFILAIFTVLIWAAIWVHA